MKMTKRILSLFLLLSILCLTLVGCSFGRKFFGFTEVGFGASGIFRIGMGYRFDAAGKNKK
jgi:hypothetical protein